MHFACNNMVGSLSIFAFILILTIRQPIKCSDDEQALFRKSVQKYLENHVIETTHADTELECCMYCLTNASCASVNYKISGISKGLCELNNRTLQQTSDIAGAITHNPEFNHLYLIEKVRETHGWRCKFEIRHIDVGIVSLMVVCAFYLTFLTHVNLSCEYGVSHIKALNGYYKLLNK